jgi:hypothetical protein
MVKNDRRDWKVQTEDMKKKVKQVVRSRLFEQDSRSASGGHKRSSSNRLVYPDVKNLRVGFSNYEEKHYFERETGKI